ncbi:hypothetical protein HAX54_007712, partial [Datura stramonium]|nr:hypothetical protein [Datura stramonium]
NSTNTHQQSNSDQQQQKTNWKNFSAEFFFFRRNNNFPVKQYLPVLFRRLLYLFLRCCAIEAVQIQAYCSIWAGTGSARRWQLDQFSGGAAHWFGCSTKAAAGPGLLNLLLATAEATAVASPLFRSTGHDGATSLLLDMLLSKAAATERRRIWMTCAKAAAVCDGPLRDGASVAAAPFSSGRRLLLFSRVAAGSSSDCSSSGSNW